ncbi:low temperature requirement protein A [Plantactinospora sp. KBS50]|uniref:low temperature requirement protein A n=1 Tax=Plantactinospora sp. KBS50 TaxID=2024580 RepID=UPI000BAAFE08|nr:low temperature requirement protein A [Plantactinospora sp. KBS50]ASW53815.1 hypothetical protein CIK06_05885 [Plantactinospora sp. KBS50]
MRARRDGPPPRRGRSARARRAPLRPRTSETPRQVDLLELFFDLVFVVGLALISQQFGDDRSWSGALHALLLLGALWWVWAITTLVTDFYDTGRPALQLLTLATTLGSLLMAAAVPSAFGLRGAVFAGAYVSIHVCRGLFLVPLLRGLHAQQRALRVLVWFVISGVAWLAGGFLNGYWRPVLWLIALGIDFVAANSGYPVPQLGRAPAREFAVIAEHVAERYQQFFIIALGDAVLVTGITMSRNDFDLWHNLAFVLAFLITTLFWRIYVHRAGQTLPGAIERSQPKRFVAAAPLTQFVMVAGVVGTAASFEVMVNHPLDPSRPATAAIALGSPALFLIGRARFEYEVFHRVSPNRLVGLAVLAGLAPVAPWCPPLVNAMAVFLVLAAIAVHDTFRSRGRPPEEPRPSG